MHENDESISPRLEKILNVVIYALVITFWINLYAFLELFFKVVLPNFGKGDLMHYIKLIITLTIAASVGETLRRSKNVLLFLSFNLLLFGVNVLTIWRNWFYH